MRRSDQCSIEQAWCSVDLEGFIANVEVGATQAEADIWMASSHTSLKQQ